MLGRGRLQEQVLGQRCETHLAVVRPVVEYGATVWHANAPQQAALESVQHQIPEQHDWLPQHH